MHTTFEGERKIFLHTRFEIHHTTFGAQTWTSDVSDEVHWEFVVLEFTGRRQSFVRTCGINRIEMAERTELTEMPCFCAKKKPFVLGL